MRSLATLIRAASWSGGHEGPTGVSSRENGRAEFLFFCSKGDENDAVEEKKLMTQEPIGNKETNKKAK